MNLKIDGDALNLRSLCPAHILRTRLSWLESLSLCRRNDAISNLVNSVEKVHQGLPHPWESLSKDVLEPFPRNGENHVSFFCLGTRHATPHFVRTINERSSFYLHSIAPAPLELSHSSTVAFIEFVFDIATHHPINQARDASISPDREHQDTKGQWGFCTTRSLEKSSPVSFAT
jgi:hypothetical protein